VVKNYAHIYNNIYRPMGCLTNPFRLFLVCAFNLTLNFNAYSWCLRLFLYCIIHSCCMYLCGSFFWVKCMMSVFYRPEPSWVWRNVSLRRVHWFIWIISSLQTGASSKLLTYWDLLCPASTWNYNVRMGQLKHWINNRFILLWLLSKGGIKTIIIVVWLRKKE